MPVEDYVRNARLIDVIDGDTIDLNVDLGFRIWVVTRVRLLGVNCPEMKKSTLEAAQAAKLATRFWFENWGEHFTIKTHLDKKDSFGRLLAEVWSQTGNSLSQYLLTTGHAVPYLG